MRGDGVLARGGRKDPTDEGARGSRKKSYFVPALRGADPQIRPHSLTFPSRPAGGPAGPARSLAPWTVAPTVPPFTPFLLLFQGRLGASRRKSRPSPLPPAGSGAEGPSRPRSQAVSQSLRPRPDPREAPPHLLGPERPRMRPGEAVGAGRGRGLESDPRHPDWSPGATWGSGVQTDGRDTLCVTGCERGREVTGAGNRDPGIPLGEPPHFLLPRPSSFPGLSQRPPPATRSHRPTAPGRGDGAT